MHHIAFNNTSFDTAILIKFPCLSVTSLEEHYINLLNELKYNTSGIIAFSLEYDSKKPTAKFRKEYLQKLLFEIRMLGINYLICADAEYFKTLTKQTKAEPHIGYVLPCAFESYEHIQIVYVINYQSYFYNPDNKNKTQLSLEALVSHSQDEYEELGTNVLTTYETPCTEAEIAFWLQKLHQYSKLTCDIEAFSLKHYNAGIGTISFSWDQHSAVSFMVDAVETKPYEIEVWDKKDKKFKKKTAHITSEPNKPVRELLRSFFETYQGKLIFHNLGYDGVVLTYQLWMDHLLDREGLEQGREIILSKSECSQVITYLATNSCAGNQLSLKAQAHEFVGNYAIDVKDIRLHKLKTILKYNAIDSCATWYTYNKNYSKMIQDNQQDIYQTIFKPAFYDIFEMHLTGMCLDIPRVKEVKKQLENIRDYSYVTILNKTITKTFIENSIENEVIERNKNYKKKVIDASEANFKFNLNSNVQLQTLLYEYFDLPVIDYTKTGQPSTAGDTLKKLINHTDNTEIQEVLQALINFIEVEKILTSFITTFLNDSIECPDGSIRIFGSYKLGGTLSGRLSSSNPNMQQVPSTSKFGKLIKSCFIAPPGMIFGMSDFDGLEDVVNTLLTRDPNKEKTIIDGFDGHSLRAYNFWPEKFSDINPDDPESINSINKNHPDIRFNAKSPHFALQYLGTWATLVKNCGFTQKEAQKIEDRYKKLYQTSFDWVASRINEATKTGYGTAAFGLRIRTPVLQQVLLGNRATPQEASAEARSLGNAISGQSYGLLNGRASMEFMKRVRASKYKHQIHLCAQIHDAIYLYWEDSLDITLWVNENLIDCMAWCDLPELQHEKIKLSSKLDIAYPTWADDITLPNNISKDQLKQILVKESELRKQDQGKNTERKRDVKT